MVNAPNSPPHKKGKHTSDTEQPFVRPPGSTAIHVSTSASFTSAICNLHKLRTNILTSEPRRPVHDTQMRAEYMGCVLFADKSKKLLLLAPPPEFHPGRGINVACAPYKYKHPFGNTGAALRHNAAAHRCLHT